MVAMAAVFAIDRHDLATITFVGMVVDILGSTYLAYDLLGRERTGFLRPLTRAITFGTPLGILAAFVANQLLSHIRFSGSIVVVDVVAALIAAPLFGFVFAPATLGLMGRFRMYRQLRHNPRLLATTLVMTAVPYGGLYYVEYQGIAERMFPGSGALGFLPVYLAAITILFLFLFVITPNLDRWLHEAPPKRFGIIGAALLLLGFALQSLPYLFIMFSVPITH